MNERDLHSSKYMLSHYHIFRVNSKKKFSPCTYYAYINLGFLRRIFGNYKDNFSRNKNGK